MFNRRTTAVFSAAFAVVLLAGVAFAGAGSLAPRAPEPLQVMSGYVAGTEPSSAPTTTLLAVAPSVSGTPGAQPEVSFTAAAGTIPFEITSPQPNERFTEEYVIFRGTAPIGWTVTAAGYAATHDEHGNWSIGLVVSPGQNKATLFATSPDGSKVEQASVIAYYDVPGPALSPAPETPSSSGASVDTSHSRFSANNKYGAAEGRKSREVYWGTGHPGDTISVVSPYGSDETSVGQNGAWDVRITFGDVPQGETFSVVVRAGNGDEALFTFTRLADEHASGSDRGAKNANDQHEPAENGRGRGPHGAENGRDVHKRGK